MVGALEGSGSALRGGCQERPRTPAAPRWRAGRSCRWRRVRRAPASQPVLSGPPPIGSRGRTSSWSDGTPRAGATSPSRARRARHLVRHPGAGGLQARKVRADRATEFRSAPGAECRRSPAGIPLPGADNLRSCQAVPEGTKGNPCCQGRSGHREGHFTVVRSSTPDQRTWHARSQRGARPHATGRSGPAAHNKSTRHRAALRSARVVLESDDVCQLLVPVPVRVRRKLSHPRDKRGPCRGPPQQTAARPAAGPARRPGRPVQPAAGGVTRSTAQLALASPRSCRAGGATAWPRRRHPARCGGGAEVRDGFPPSLSCRQRPGERCP